MQPAPNIRCPSCNSEEFVTMPNRYDLLKFVDGNFEVIKSEFTEEEYRIFCRECGASVDINETIRYKKVILRKIPTKFTKI
jgi:transcription elongation factor Elf1